MKNVFTRPLRPEDVVLLDQYRRLYEAADLELPKDFNSEGVKSVVGTKRNRLITSLTGINAVILDPLIRNPDADPTDVLFALIKMETVLTNWAMERGCVDSYIAIPNQIMGKYGRLLQNYGYAPTIQNCSVLRRPLLPDFIPLLGPERDAQRAEAALITEDDNND